jgi:hypothetical protein
MCDVLHSTNGKRRHFVLTCTKSENLNVCVLSILVKRLRISPILRTCRAAFKISRGMAKRLFWHTGGRQTHSNTKGGIDPPTLPPKHSPDMYKSLSICSPSEEGKKVRDYHKHHVGARKIKKRSLGTRLSIMIQMPSLSYCFLSYLYMEALFLRFYPKKR